MHISNGLKIIALASSALIAAFSVNSGATDTDISNPSTEGSDPLPSPQNSSLEAAPIAATAVLRLNQLGFTPTSTKLAVVPADGDVELPAKTKFLVRDIESGEPVYQSALQRSQEKSWAGEQNWILDFSRVTHAGNYQLEIPALNISEPFSVAPDTYDALANASLKAFYFQRASAALSSEHAGIWARAAGHPDDKVLIHPSAATDARPENTRLSAPKGWYDAGDYNKYVVNSGITMATLMSAFERYPHYFAAQSLNIPESGNELPDILDEVLYNLDWLAAMQDPADGGVYHKLTTAGFEGMVAAHKAIKPRYLVQKTTTATLDFAAVMAQASRVYAPYFPNAAGDYLKAAQHAWQWAEKNPAVPYRQNLLNQQYEPDIITGAYDDEHLDDERYWAAAELYLASKDRRFWQVIESAPTDFQLPNWASVRWLGNYSLIAHKEERPKINTEWRAAVEKSLLTAARQLRAAGNRSAYRVPMVTERHHFVWGSNAVAANQGILFLEAHRISGDVAFLRSAEDTRDYLLGRNATGYSYVTGFGDKSPQHPHHRLAAARPDLPPLPGFLVGGPNPSQQDGCGYTSKIPDESFTDHVCSYASNEIAINWNAPLAFLVNGLQAVEQKHTGVCPHHE